MQLQFSPDELQVMVDALEELDCELRRQVAQAQDDDSKWRLRNEEHQLDELEGKLIRRDLRLSIDELDLLATELGRCHSIPQKEMLLESVRDKVTEACAMA